ncbi:hypothetical protein_gp051 [Bacillus phage vB_BceM_WH1]|nr:hypothetical protein_gp051 [Bacillus phage vB_BceM_WH1]
MEQQVRNLIGKKFGMLTVQSVNRITEYGDARWNCICDCGKETVRGGQYLTVGKNLSCGCTNRMNRKEPMYKRDFTGYRFGNLTAIKQLEQLEGSDWMWECVCDCGNKKVTRIRSLLSGGTSSCGCLSSAIKVDEVGNEYGLLEVIKDAGTLNAGHASWLCRCKCGKQIILSGAYLRRGYYDSCGCTKDKTHLTDHQIYSLVVYELTKEFEHYSKHGDVSLWNHSFNDFADWSLETGFELGKRLVPKDSTEPLSLNNYKWI